MSVAVWDGIEVLYEQGPCFVVNKPGGVLTQAVPGVDSLEVRIKRLSSARQAKHKATSISACPIAWIGPPRVRWCLHGT